MSFQESAINDGCFSVRTTSAEDTFDFILEKW